MNPYAWEKSPSAYNNILHKICASLEIKNWVSGLTAGYSNEDSKETVTLSGPNLDIQEGKAGAAQYRHFATRNARWFQPILDPGYTPVAYTETTTQDGSRQWVVELPKRVNVVGLVHSGPTSDVVCLELSNVVINGIKSHLGSQDQFCVIPMRAAAAASECVPEKPMLSVEHGSDSITASITPSSDGGFEATVDVNGTGYHKGELLLRRTFNKHFLEESIGQVGNGTATFSWKPTAHSFDFIAICPVQISDDESVISFFQSLDAAIHLGFTLKVDLICDGPGMQYGLYLKGHRLLSSDEDSTKLSITFE